MTFFSKLSKLGNSILSINRRNGEYIYRWNLRKYLRVADDKSLTKEQLKALNIPIPQTYMTIRFMGDIGTYWSRLKEHTSLVIKPARGRAGGGIMILDKMNNHWQTPSRKEIEENDIRAHIADIIFGNYSLGISDAAIVEEKIIQHSFFSDIYQKGVADIRLILFNHDPVMAMSRIPTDRSNGRANLHQGALGVKIDLASGTFGQAYTYKGYTDKHPDSGAEILGKPIPFWDDLLKLSIRLAQNMPLKYLGVDIVIDHQKGPMIMEINARPGLEIQNVNQQGLLKNLNSPPLLQQEAGE